MATINGIPILSLPAVQAAQLTDVFPVVQDGLTQQETVQQLLSLIDVEAQSIKDSCRACSTTNLTATYDNGASGVGATLTNSSTQAQLEIDWIVNLFVGDRVLVNGQSSSFQNGIYVITVLGDSSTNWVLTRSDDYDQINEINYGDFLVVVEGTINGSTGWIQDQYSVATIGVSAILFEPLLPPSPLNLQRGGTGSNLAASNGGIFYSTASAGAILSGTATASQVLLSGASTTPSWSTATYPTTTTINQILYSSSANTIAGLATANSGVLVTNGSGVPSISTGGQIPGTTTNNNANAGNIGELIQADTGGSPISLTTSTLINIVQISLTAGDWDVYGSAFFSMTGGGTESVAGISLVSTVLPPQAFSLSEIDNASGIGTLIGFSTPTLNLSLSTTTTVYLVGGVTFASGPGTAQGRLYARRAR
jgi:hypothetical protein